MVSKEKWWLGVDEELRYVLYAGSENGRQDRVVAKVLSLTDARTIIYFKSRITDLEDEIAKMKGGSL